MIHHPGRFGESRWRQVRDALVMTAGRSRCMARDTKQAASLRMEIGRLRTCVLEG
jgi:hypothetical protein